MYLAVMLGIIALVTAASIASLFFKKCPKCGVRNGLEARSCKKCGAAFPEEK
jgi:ribosomal protein L40E